LKKKQYALQASRALQAMAMIVLFRKQHVLQVIVELMMYTIMLTLKTLTLIFAVSAEVEVHACWEVICMRTLRLPAEAQLCRWRH